VAAVADPVIELDDVRKTYDAGGVRVEAVRGVSLVVERGEYLAVMGPSGSGKSTLMHILGVLDVPTSGTYRLAGADVSCLDERELAEVRNQHIGFVFQQFHLLSSMPAWRNVEMPLVYAGVGRRLRRERAVDALARVGIADRLDHRATQLSGGQQQRVAVARALVTDPDIVLADEPTGNLDSASTAEVLGLLAEVHAAGRTVVVITHEPDVAAAAGRVVRLRDGLVVDDTRRGAAS
jgi:putative ABC transport system ATP-binding protein